MKKTIIFLVMIFALAFSVSAWHCTDTDAVRPPKVNGTYGFWGDNGLLGGTSYGYLDKNVPLPENCTGTRVNLAGGKFYYKNVVCNDRCDGYTLIEYYCGDRPRFPGETVMFWKYYENSEQCGYEIPEFTSIGIVLAAASVLGLLILKRK